MADTVDAMGDRPYRKGRDEMFITEELKRCSRPQFDPAVVEAFGGSKKNIFPVCHPELVSGSHICFASLPNGERTEVRGFLVCFFNSKTRC